MAGWLEPAFFLLDKAFRVVVNQLTMSSNIKALAQEIQWLSPAELNVVSQQIWASRQMLGAAHTPGQEGYLLGAALSNWAQTEIEGEK